MTKDMTNNLFVFNQKDAGHHHFDQVFSYISLKGLLDYINVFTERDIDTTHIEVDGDK